MVKTELLAPAKNKEIAFAAIDCGADAVYIGATSFGARASAGNSIDDIKEVVDYAHKFWAKVFVTVNTILKDNELGDAYELVKQLSKIGVDAILIQDMGLLNCIIKNQKSFQLPNIHASTQCDNRSLEKVKFLRDIGFQRVVLARELSLNQIKEIHKEVPDIELEFFVHGALCVSYSGQCYLSQYIGGRSANRGECAQPCRKQYSVVTDTGEILAENIYPLCMKDFNASDNIKEMINSGIFSFKIEGRLKDIGYVKNIVSYYRQELDKYSKKASSGKIFCSFIPNPEKSFNRGFTNYFLKERGNCFNLLSPKSRGEFIGKVISSDNNCITVITDKKLNAQDGIYFENNKTPDGFLINKVITNENKIIIYPNKKINIKNGTKIYRNQNPEFEKEITKPTKRQIGATVNVYKNKINIKDEDGNNIEVLIQRHEEAKNSQKMNENFVKQFSKTNETDFYINSINIDYDLPFMPISEINKLRRGCFELLMAERIKNYPKNTQQELKYTNYYIKECDYKTNINNQEAKEFYEKCGCKVNEMGIETHLPEEKQVELMRTKHCIKYALNMCKSPLNLILRDEKGQNYPLKFYCKECEMAVLSPVCR